MHTCSLQPDCFNCSNWGDICSWEGSECVPSENKTTLNDFWFTPYLECPQDPLNLCVEKESNTTYEASMTKQGQDLQYLPKNYFCHFSHIMEANKTYSVDLYRLNRRDYQEEITLLYHPYSEDAIVDYEPIIMTDRDLRRGQQTNRMSSSSKMSMLVHQLFQVRIEIYSRAQKSITHERTWRMQISSNFVTPMQRYYSYQSAMFSFMIMLILCTCGFKMLKFCVMKCRHMSHSRNIRANVAGISEEERESRRRRRDERGSRVQMEGVGAGR